VTTNIDVSRLAGFFKDRFGENASALPSEGYDILQRRIPFSQADQLGERLSEPVRMSHSTGWTFAGGSTTGTMFALNAPKSPQTVEASWTSQEFVLRERTSWKALRAAQTSKQAFANAYDEMVRDMKNSADFACEFSMLYGTSSLGRVESQTGSSTSRVYVLTKASSTAGLWYKMQGALFDVYDAENAGTKLNTNADVVIVSADIADADGKVVLSVTGNATDLTAIDAAIATGAFLIPKGAEGNMMVGINAISTNTGAYAGINATSFPLWRSTSLNANAAAATFSKFMQALKRNRLKSGPGMRTALISEATAHDLIDNLSALQRFVNKSGGGDFDLGGGGMTFHGPSGHIEFMPHVLVKEGEAFILDLKEFKRIGSVEFTFDPTGKGTYFEHVSGFAGLELVGYWDQSIICKKPGSITKITNIVNTY
jgi:hypothetical protein